MPVGIHGRAAILGHDHEIALVGAGARGVLDRHIGPGAGDHDGVAAAGAQHGFQLGAFEGAHADFFDDEVAGLRLEAGDRRCAPAAAHHRLGVEEAFEQRRVEREAGRARLDDEPDMDDHHAAGAADIRQPADIVDHILLACMLRRAGGSKRPAVHHDVVLHILDDERAARRIQRHALFGAGALWALRPAPKRRSLPTRRRKRRARAHERLDMRADLGAHAVERMRCGHEQRAPVGLAPVQIGDQFRDADFAEQRAVLAVNPEAARRRDPDIAGAVTFHAVRHAGFQFGSGCRTRKSGPGRACRRR